MHSLTVLLYQYGVIAMFLCILLEYACFPVSSEIVLPLSGAIASINGTHYFVILPLSIAAGLIGTSFCYLLGWLGGSRLLTYLPKRFPKWKKPLDASFSWFERYGKRSVLIGRMIPLCRTYIAFVAGAGRQSYHEFALYSSIGITIWNAILIGLGYLLRENWKLVKLWYQRYEGILLMLLGTVLFLLALHLYRKSSRKASDKRK